MIRNTLRKGPFQLLVRHCSGTDSDCVSPAEVGGKLMPSAEKCVTTVGSQEP